MCKCKVSFSKKLACEQFLEKITVCTTILYVKIDFIMRLSSCKNSSLVVGYSVQPFFLVT